MFFEDSVPFVRQALIGHLTKNNPYDLFHPLKAVDARLFFIRTGSGFMGFEAERHPLRSGTVILLGPGVSYTWEVEDVSYYSINFDFTRGHAHITQTSHPIHAELFDSSEILDPVCFDNGVFPQWPLVVQGFSELENDFQQLVAEYQVGAEHWETLASSLLKALIIRILRRYNNPRPCQSAKTAAILEQVTEYIAANYSGNLSNAAIAEAFHFSPVYLNRIFKSYTGQPLHGFVLQYRINRAMELLRTRNISVCEAGRLCGFSSPYHFSKAFHRHTGRTPSDYQRRAD